MMRPGTTFMFTAPAPRAAHGSRVFTAHTVIRQGADGVAVVNVAQGSAHTLRLTPGEYEVLTAPPAPYLCEHCARTHGDTLDTLVTITLCPGGDCEDDCPEVEAEAMCFGDYEAAEAYAQERSEVHAQGAALIWSVYTAGENHDVQACIATVVRGNVLTNA